MLKTIVRLVPWFSMTEWRAVYELVYSDNPEDQQCGLERLVGWKARCPSLPAAVECTLGIFQVLLQDPDHVSEKGVSMLREQQLCLMYSTAVMRFLNLMLEVKTDDDFGGSMYSKAEKHSIPEWIVNLRHDAAHGTSLPDLSLLRAAAVFICKWLHEHYWEREAEAVNDWLVTKDDLDALSADEVELGKIMETWEALSLYDLTGFDNMRQIPDDELKTTIASINRILYIDGEEVTQNRKQLKYTKLPTALSLVIRKLVRFFKDCPGTVDKASLLVNIIVGGDFLLPSENLMDLMFPNGWEPNGIMQQLPPALTKCCADLLSTLWDLGVIPVLLSKLISTANNIKDSNLRRNIAALWVQKLSLSCLKVREARKVRSAILDRLDCKSIYLSYKDMSPGANRKAIVTSIAFAAVENQRPDLKMGYSWKIVHIPDSLTNLNLIKESIWPLPSNFSPFFLPCLFELSSLPLETRKLLLDLVITCSNAGSSLIDDLDDRVYSTSDLPSIACMEVVKKSLYANENFVSNPFQETGEQSHWSLSQGHLEWQKCPLGLLPWQQEQHHLDKIEYEDGRWPMLSLPGEWATSTNDFENVSEPQNNGQSVHCDRDGLVSSVSNLRRVKDGRICKTPLKKKIFNQLKRNPIHVENW